MFRVNGKALVLDRPGICTIAELIDREVLEELMFWKVNMENYFKDIYPSKAMRHDAYKRVNRRLRQVRYGA